MGYSAWPPPPKGDDLSSCSLRALSQACGWPYPTLVAWAKEGKIKPTQRGGAKYNSEDVYRVHVQRNTANLQTLAESRKKPRQALRVDGMSKSEASLHWSIARAQRAKLELAARSGELITTECVERLLGMLGKIANEGHSQTRNKLTAMVGADALQVLDDEHARTMARMVEEIRGHKFNRWGEDAGANPPLVPGDDSNNRPTKGSERE